MEDLQYHDSPQDEAKRPFAFPKTLNWESLFGELKTPQAGVKIPLFKPGLVHLANHGVLMLPLEELLAQPVCGFSLRICALKVKLKGLETQTTLCQHPS